MSLYCHYIIVFGIRSLIRQYLSIISLGSSFGHYHVIIWLFVFSYCLHYCLICIISCVIVEWMNVIMFPKYDEEEVGQRWMSAGRRWIIIIAYTIMGSGHFGAFAHAMHVAVLLNLFYPSFLAFCCCWICIAWRL